MGNTPISCTIAWSSPHLGGLLFISELFDLKVLNLMMFIRRQADSFIQNVFKILRHLKGNLKIKFYSGQFLVPLLA